MLMAFSDSISSRRVERAPFMRWNELAFLNWLLLALPARSATNELARLKRRFWLDEKRSGAVFLRVSALATVRWWRLLLSKISLNFCLWSRLMWPRPTNSCTTSSIMVSTEFLGEFKMIVPLKMIEGLDQLSSGQATVKILPW